jgi:hypothetical protein
VIDCGSLEYAHARLHARHGQRLGEVDWRRIEALRDFAPMLETARATALRPWLLGLGAASTAHDVEAGLRGRWRELVGEVAAWMPAAWQACVQWCRVWPDLPVLQHLARGGAPAAWLHDDAVWRDLAAAAPQERMAVLGAGAYAALAPAWVAPQALARLWWDEWQRRLPGSRSLGSEGDQLLLLLQRTLRDHRQAFEQAAPTQGWQQRAALRARLALLWRRAALDPAAAFIHLALAALDLERLRAELLRRILFPHALPHTKAA